MDLAETTDDGKDMQSSFVYLITLISLEIFFSFGFFRYFLIKFDIGSNSIDSANSKSLQHITSHHNLIEYGGMYGAIILLICELFDDSQ